MTEELEDGLTPYLLLNEFARAKKEHRNPSPDAVSQMGALAENFLNKLEENEQTTFEEVAYPPSGIPSFASYFSGMGQSKRLRTFLDEMKQWRRLNIAIGVEFVRIANGGIGVDAAVKLYAEDKKISASTVKNAYRWAKKIQNLGYEQGVFGETFPQRAISHYRHMMKFISEDMGREVSAQQTEEEIRKYKKLRDVLNLT